MQTSTDAPNKSATSPVWKFFSAAAVFVVPCVVAIVIFALTTTHPTNRAHEAAHRNNCLANLRNIGTALNNYHASHGALPAVYTQDRDGKPLTSWRTRILPYLERTDVYVGYDNGQPWDSPNNKTYAGVPLDIFRCPSDAAPRNPQTNYVAILAPDSAWQPGKKTKLSDITDDPADTILVVEMKNSEIAWAEPRDLDLERLPAGLTQENLLKSLSGHPGNFNALFADGHAESIPDNIPWADFLAMLSIAGGEKIDRSKWVPVK